MEKKRYDVLAMGELLIDFIQQGISDQGNPLFEANPGGAPCNVLAMLSRLERKTCFLGKVGDDSFGIQLKRNLDKLGIDTSGLFMDKEVPTTLAIVHTAADGDRDFSFYRNPGADMMLAADEIREELIKESRIFHFGSLSMTHEGVREATKKGLEMAKKNGCIISFDPNLRLVLWKEPKQAREQIIYGLGQSDIVKISDDEVLFVSGCAAVEEGARKIKEKYDNIRLLLVTLGKRGSIAFYQGKEIKAEPFLTSRTIETTGAGDTFCGCILHFILEYGLNHLSEARLKEMLTFANAAASLITTRRGALNVMPEKKEVEESFFGMLLPISK